MGFIPFTLIDFIDIFLVACLMFGIYRATRGTNAPYIFFGMAEDEDGKNVVFERQKCRRHDHAADAVDGGHGARQEAAIDELELLHLAGDYRTDGTVQALDEPAGRREEQEHQKVFDKKVQE